MDRRRALHRAVEILKHIDYDDSAGITFKEFATFCSMYVNMVPNRDVYSVELHLLDDDLQLCRASLTRLTQYTVELAMRAVIRWV